MELTASIIAIGAVCSAITAILALIGKIHKPIKEMSKKLDGFYTWQKNQQDDIDASKEEREILCRGFRALSTWAIGQGANGEVQRASGELGEFLSKHAHKGKSYPSER